MKLVAVGVGAGGGEDGVGFYKVLEGGSGLAREEIGESHIGTNIGHEVTMLIFLQPLLPLQLLQGLAPHLNHPLKHLQIPQTVNETNIRFVIIQLLSEFFFCCFYQCLHFLQSGQLFLELASFSVNL